MSYVQVIPFLPKTLIFCGTNASGKTSITRALGELSKKNVSRTKNEHLKLLGTVYGKKYLKIKKDPNNEYAETAIASFNESQKNILQVNDEFKVDQGIVTKEIYSRHPLLEPSQDLESTGFNKTHHKIELNEDIIAELTQELNEDIKQKLEGYIIEFAIGEIGGTLNSPEEHITNLYEVNVPDKMKEEWVTHVDHLLGWYNKFRKGTKEEKIMSGIEMVELIEELTEGLNDDLKQKLEEYVAKFAIGEIGGTFKSPKECISRLYDTNVKEENKKEWLNFVDSLLNKYTKFREGTIEFTGGTKEEPMIKEVIEKPSCFERIKKSYKLPSDAKVVWLVDLGKLTSIPINEKNPYLSILREQMESFKSYYGPYIPHIILTKADYLSEDKILDKIINEETPKEDGTIRIKNIFKCPESEAKEIQKGITVDYSPEMISKLCNKVEEYINESIDVSYLAEGLDVGSDEITAKVWGISSILDKGLYREAIKSLVKIVACASSG